MLPVLVKVSSGWKCERCDFVTFSDDAATLHVREHGVNPREIAIADDGIYSLQEVELPDVLRMEGRI